MHSSDESPLLGSRTWQTVGRPLLLVPLGSTEQHGPHLPLDTDTRVASAVAERLAGLLREEGIGAVAAPAIAYGSSGEHEAFPGTISIGREALALLLLEFGRSASGWAERVVFVNGHGGNVDALSDSVPTLRREGRDAAWLACTLDPRDAPPAHTGDAHAGRTETSLIEHLHPDDVRRDRAERGATAPLDGLLPRLRTDGVRAVAPNGVLGDPAGASADEGRQIFDAICAGALRRLKGGRVTANGRLDG